MNAALATRSMRALTRSTKGLPMLGVGALLCLGLLALDGAFGSAFAQAGQQVFADLNAKTTDLFYNGRTIILIVCSIAIIVTMVGAISGRFPMQKAIVLAGAIFIIAVASSVVTYFASPGTVGASGAVPALTDTGTAAG